MQVYWAESTIWQPSFHLLYAMDTGKEGMLWIGLDQELLKIVKKTLPLSKLFFCHNTSIYDECKTQSEKVLALPWKWDHQDISNDTPQATCYFQVSLPLPCIRRNLDKLQSKSEGCNLETRLNVAGYCLNRLCEHVHMAECTKPLLTKFGMYHRLESCLCNEWIRMW